MERPIEKNRWDKPLFTIWPEDQLNFEEIYKHLFDNQKTMKQTRTTTHKVKLGNNYSYKTDKILQDIFDDCVKKLNENKKFMGNKYVFLKVGTKEIKLKKDISINSLKKWKNEFISMNKLNPFETVEAIQEAFVYFLSSKLN